jgi:hypothetical protein
MIKSLKERTVQPMREVGFAGSFPHFRRVSATRTDLLTFQPTTDTE